MEKGVALGRDYFATQIEALTNRRVMPEMVGRPQNIINNVD